MKVNLWLSSVAAFCVVLCSLSVALQIKQWPSKYEKYRDIPASDLQRRWLSFDVEMIRMSMPLEDGVGLPYVFGPSADKKKLVIRSHVDSKALPKAFEDRRLAILRSAASAQMVFSATFGDDTHLKFDDDVVIEYVDVGLWLGSSGKEGVVAVYENGRLTFH